MLERIINGDSSLELKKLPDNHVDLTMTSPPYDGLRDYNGYSFDFETIAKELYRVTKDGGVVVWVVGDSVIDGSESGTSFKQALYFKEIGFNLHDTMIYQRPAHFPDKLRYSQSFEYMFVLSKGKPNTFNPIIDHKNKPDSHNGRESVTGGRNKDGTHNKKIRPIPRSFSNRWNIWDIPNGYMKSTKDKISYEHPAIFPEKLAEDHIISWSNEGDIVLDPFAGSGTTLKMAKINRRNFIGIEMSLEYCEIIKKRLDKYNNHSLELFLGEI
jgi:DNA modification methylase